MNMNKTINKLDGISIYFYAIVSIIVLIAQFWALNKGLIFSDEAWYACLLRDQPTGLATQFNLLFKNVFNGDLYSNRLCAYLIRLLGSIVLSIGIYIYDNNIIKSGKSYWQYLFFIIIGQMVLGPISINYLHLSLIIGEICIGLLLLSLAKEKWFILVGCGFFVAFLIPIKITSIILLPCILIVIALFTTNKFKNIIWLLLGVAVNIVLYFSFIEDPIIYFNALLNNTQRTIERGSNDYGIIYLIKYIFDAFVYYFRFIILAVFIYSTFKYCNNLADKKKSIISLIIISILLCLYFVFDGSFPIKGKTLLKPHFLLWLYVFVLLVSRPFDKKSLLALFFLLVPFCLSFGSDAPVYAKTIYLPFVTLSIIYLLNKKLQNVVFMFITIILFYSFIQKDILKRDWYGNKWLDQTESVKNLGIDQKIKLDKRYYLMTENVQNLVKPGDSVLCDMHSWGFVTLLNLQPMDYAFRIDTTKAKEKLLIYVKKNIPIAIILEQNDRTKGIINFADSIQNVEKYEIGYKRILLKNKVKEKQ